MWYIETVQYRVDPEKVIETLLTIIALETTEFEAYLTGLEVYFSEVYFKRNFEESSLPMPKRFLISLKIFEKDLLEYIERYEIACMCAEEYLKIRPNKDSDEEPNKDSDEKPYGDPDEILKRLTRVMVYQPTVWNDKFASVFNFIPTDLDLYEEKDSNLFNYEGLAKSYKKSFDYDGDYDLDLLRLNQFIDIKKSILDFSPKQRDQFDQKWGRMLKMRSIIDFPKPEDKAPVLNITVVFLLFFFFCVFFVFLLFSKSYRI